MENLKPIEIDPKTFLYQHCELPVLPDVLTKIQSTIASGDYTAKLITDIISNDPSIVAEIIKIANSAYFNLPREIKEVKFAVAYLGIVEIQRIVLSISIVNTLSTADRKNFDKVWFHSVYTALCTKYLAAKYEPLVVPGEIWAAAILHDIGKLVYLKFFPDHYQVLEKYADQNGCLFSDAEQFYNFPSSSYLGSLLCDRWRLPVEIKDICENHSIKTFLTSKDSSNESTFRRLVSAGNLFAIMLSNKLNNTYSDKIKAAMTKVLNISESDFLLIIADLTDMKREAEKLIAK